jgi:hypothetical protein
MDKKVNTLAPGDKKLFVVFSYDCSPSKGEGKSLLDANFVLNIKETMVSLPQTPNSG